MKITNASFTEIVYDKTVNLIPFEHPTHVLKLRCVATSGATQRVDIIELPLYYDTLTDSYCSPIIEEAVLDNVVDYIKKYAST